MARRGWVLGAAAAVVGVVGAVVAAVALTSPSPDAPSPAEATAVAARVGESLRTGRVVPDTFDKPDAAAQLTALRRGMAPLVPEVVVSDVMADEAAGTGSAVVEQRWIIHTGKAAWSVTTTVPLARTADGWRARWGPWIVEPSLGEGDWLRATRLSAQRGEIVGAHETRLVFRQAVQRVVLDVGTDRAAALASATQAAAILEIAPEPLLARVRAASDSTGIEIATLRTLDPGQRARIAPLAALPGVTSTYAERMLALTPTFARPLLGTVGPATADAIAASDGEVRDGDQVGLTGLQHSQDRVLRGSTGFVVQRVEAGGAVSELFRVAPLAGANVRVAIDADLQERADAAVADAVGSGGSGGSGPADESVAVVVLRIADGHVLAAASAGGGGRSIATIGRFAIGPAAAGLADAVGPLRWGTDGDLGVAAFLGEVSGQAWASPLGLAQAAASVTAGEAVIPVVVVEGVPARPALSAGQLAALASGVDRADADPHWAVVRSGETVVVAYRASGDADALARAAR